MDTGTGPRRDAHLASPVCRCAVLLRLVAHARTPARRRSAETTTGRTMARAVHRHRSVRQLGGGPRRCLRRRLNGLGVIAADIRTRARAPPVIESAEGRRERPMPFACFTRSGRTSHWSSVGGRRLWRGHNSGKVGGHGHPFGATVATVALQQRGPSGSENESGCAGPGRLALGFARKHHRREFARRGVGARGRIWPYVHFRHCWSATRPAAPLSPRLA